jgi:hypothetical protein
MIRVRSALEGGQDASRKKMHLIIGSFSATAISYDKRAQMTSDVVWAPRKFLVLFVSFFSFQLT